MKTSEKIAQLRRQLTIIESGKLVQIAAQDTHVQMVDRIFNKGLNAQDGQIGTYNTSNELYVNPNNSPKKFPTKGKTGESKFKNGEPHKTGYFESYSNYRSKVGRPTSKVNLVLFGDLQNDFGKAVFKLTETKYASLVRGANGDKVEGAEAKYGNIFRLTPKERTNFKQVLAFETFRMIKNA